MELKADSTSWLVCDNAPVQPGTWSQEATTGDIRLIILAVNTSNPSGPDLQLVITDVVVTASSFSGTITNFPLPLDLTQPFGLPGTGPLFDPTTSPPGPFSSAPGSINAQLVGVPVSFNRVQ